MFIVLEKLIEKTKTTKNGKKLAEWMEKHKELLLFEKKYSDKFEILLNSLGKSFLLEQQSVIKDKLGTYNKIILNKILEENTHYDLMSEQRDILNDMGKKLIEIENLKKKMMQIYSL